MQHIIRYGFILLLFFTYSLGFNEYDKAVIESLHNGGKLYKKACSSCHGKKGDKIPPGNFSSDIIAGMDKEELLNILTNYRNGLVDNGGAKGIMSANLMRYKFAHQDLDDIAYYVSTLGIPQPKAKDSQTQGYYFQVAAYRGEIPKEILSQIEKYSYIVYVSIEDAKPLYRYLIGVYANNESMKADKKAITQLTKTTHIQKNMKPIVRYLNANNELLEVQDSKPTQVIATASEIITKEKKQKDTQESKKSIISFIVQESEKIAIKLQQNDTKIQDSTQKSIKGLADGYYFILATYAKNIPQSSLDILHSTPYVLHKQNGYTYVLIGGYEKKQELLKHTAYAQKLTTHLHTHKQKYEKPRLVYLHNQHIVERYKDKN